MILQIEEQVADFFEEADREEMVVWDIESTGLNVYTDDWIIGHSFYLPTSDRSVYIPVRHQHPSATNVDVGYVNQYLRQLFFPETRVLLTHNGKFDIKFARKEGVEFYGKLADTLLMAHLHNENERELNPSIKNPYGLKPLGVRYLGHDADAEEQALLPYLEEWHLERIAPLQEEIDGLETRMKAIADTYKSELRAKDKIEYDRLKAMLTKKWEKEHGPLSESLRASYVEHLAVLKGRIADSDHLAANTAHLCRINSVYAEMSKQRTQAMDAITKIKKVTSKSILAELPIEPVAKYAEQDVKLTYRLWRFFKPRLEAVNLYELFLGAKEDLCDYARAVHRMEWNGLLVDQEYVEQQIERCHREQERLREEAFRLAGGEFNLASPKQVGELIGQKATNKEALEECEHPVAQTVLEYRKWGKAEGTYFQPFKTKLDGKGRIHPDFFLHGTVSGRASGSVFMTFPRENDTYNVRGMVVAPPGYTMVDADLSQAELRLYAFFTKEPLLVKAYQENTDIHTQTAQLLGLEAMGFPPKQARQIGKRINFTTIYGAGPDGLIHALKMEGVRGISYEQAKEFLDRYRSRFPRAARWMRETNAFAQRNGYVRLWTGRLRRFPTLTAGHGGTYNKSHTAVNNIIQGGVSEIIRVAITRIDRMIEDTPIELWLQVHDSLVLVMPDDYVEEWVPKVLKKMETVAKFGEVPIVSEAKVGKRWNELVAWEGEKNG